MPSEQIYQTLLERTPHNKHYVDRYYNFILSCSKEGSKHFQTNYTTTHHILPKAANFWPQYKNLTKHRWNSIVLTHRQHFLAHWMLARAFGGVMWYAVQRMSTSNQKEFYTNTKVYEEAMIHVSRMSRERALELWANRREEMKLKFKESWTQERKLHHSNALRSYWSEGKRNELSERYSGYKNPMYGRNHSEESKQAMSMSRKGVAAVKEHSEETKQKMRELAGIRESSKTVEEKATISNKISQKAKNRKRLECPHCGKWCQPGTAKRWHFDNCKHKNIMSLNSYKYIQIITL